jgi:hypothetical protein
MRLIAHRGNIYGPNPEKENTVEYIVAALFEGYDVEIDIRFMSNKFYLGHDIPQEECSIAILQRTDTWIHAKDIITLHECMMHGFPNVFFHDRDDVVLTSSGYLWTFPGKELTTRSIQVMPEISNHNFNDYCFGICSDRVGEY